MENKSRIEYFDTAKGFCIILVVIFHMAEYYQVTLPLASFTRAFRMPLYFFLSGIFFKDYGGFTNFLRKKTNKLLIPFLFFYLTLSWIVPYVLYRLGGVALWKVADRSSFSVLFDCVVREDFPNTPIWFLLCLFNVNILFFICYLVSEWIPQLRTKIIIVMSLIFGLCGLLLWYYHVNLPLFIDSSFTALPFFMAGYVIKNKTNFMRANRIDRFAIPFVLLCFVTVYFCARYDISFKQNLFFGYSYLSLYPCGLLGTLGIIYCAKLFGNIPGISYWGRYSIMILVTHYTIFQFLSPMVRFITGGYGNVACLMVNMVITLTLYFYIIPFMKKYLPYVTAQKDIL